MGKIGHRQRATEQKGLAMSESLSSGLLKHVVDPLSDTHLIFLTSHVIRHRLLGALRHLSSLFGPCDLSQERFFHRNPNSMKIRFTGMTRSLQNLLMIRQMCYKSMCKYMWRFDGQQYGVNVPPNLNSESMSSVEWARDTFHQRLAVTINIWMGIPYRSYFITSHLSP